MHKKELSWQKKETRSLSAVTSGVTTPKSFLLVVEGAMCSSLDDALANLSDRKSVVLGKGVVVWCDLGGGRRGARKRIDKCSAYH